jgi:tetratricopeptide (TPR) repeat protein
METPFSKVAAFGSFVVLCVLLCDARIGYSIEQPDAVAARAVFDFADVIARDIERAVRDLGYSDSDAVETADISLRWKDPNGCPALVELKRRLASGIDWRNRDKLSTAELATLEGFVANMLALNIAAEVPFDVDCALLSEVLTKKKTNCFGCTQLFYVLGRSIGLQVKATPVEKCFEEPASRRGEHIACLVELSDGKAKVIDIAYGIYSEAFVFEEQYKKNGDLWRLRDDANPLNIHPVIRVVDENALAAEILRVQGCKVYDSDRARAMEWFEKAIARNPRDPRALLSRGGHYHELGQSDQAMLDVNKAIELSPECCRGYVLRARIFSDLKQPDRALADYGKAIEADRTFYLPYLDRGIYYRKSNRLDEAEGDLTKAIELNPTERLSFSLRGDIYFMRRNYAKAIADYTQYLEGGSDDEIRGRRGVAYYHVDKYDDAVADLSKAIENGVKDDLLYTWRGNSYYFLGLFDHAIDDYAHFIQLHPKDAVAYCRRGDAFNCTERYDLAADDFTKAIVLDGSQARSYFGRGYAYFRLRRYREAIDDGLKVAQIEPNNEEALLALAAAYDGAKDYEQAIAIVDRVIELNPGNCCAYQNKGGYYRKLKKFDSALECENKAIKLDPNFAEAYGCRATIQAELGNVEDAKRDLRKALELKPELRKMIDRTAAKYKLGDLDETKATASEETGQSRTTATTPQRRSGWLPRRPRNR